MADISMKENEWCLLELHFLPKQNFVITEDGLVSWVRNNLSKLGEVIGDAHFSFESPVEGQTKHFDKHYDLSEFYK